MGRVVRVELSKEVELSRGSSGLVGRVFCGSSIELGRVVSWVELSQGSSCLVGRVYFRSSCHMGRDDLTTYSTCTC